MDRAMLNGIELEYEVTGSGEPLLLIGTGPIADGFLPFRSAGVLADRYRLITYRQRGQSTGTLGRTPVSFPAHAADAAALLRHLGVRRAHVAGHSTGAAIALEVAIAHPPLVHTLILLEPPLLGVPAAAAFFERAGAALAAYDAGDREEAMMEFLSVVSSLDRERCRRAIEEQVPGGVGRAVNGADAFFRSYLPALAAWEFGADRAAAISRPVLSVCGSGTEPLFAEGQELLRSWFPQLESCTIRGIGHLLHMERPQPVVRGVAEFLARHPITAAEPGERETAPRLPVA